MIFTKKLRKIMPLPDLISERPIDDVLGQTQCHVHVVHERRRIVYSVRHGGWAVESGAIYIFSYTWKKDFIVN